MSSSAARWAAFTVWAVVAASAVAWGLRLFSPGPAMPPHTLGVAEGQALRGDPARLLGAAPVAPAGPAKALPPASARFALVGVLAPRSPAAANEGVAVIAIDGDPPRAFRVGARVDGDLVLKRVRAKGADLGPHGSAEASMALELPPLPPPATGTLPRAVSGRAAARPAPPPPVLRRQPAAPAPAAPENSEDAQPDEVEPADEAPQADGEEPGHGGDGAPQPRPGVQVR